MPAARCSNYMQYRQLKEHSAKVANNNTTSIIL